MNAHSKTKLAIAAAIIAIFLVVLGTWLYTKITSDNLAKSAMDRSTTSTKEIMGSKTTLAHITDSQCNRTSLFQASHCEEADVTVYDVDNLKSFDTSVSAALKANGWFADSKQDPEKYFFYFEGNGTPVALAHASRNLSQQPTGEVLPSDILISVTRTAPKSDGQYVMSSRFHYTDATLEQKLKNIISSGHVIAFVTVFNYYQPQL